MLTSLSPWEHLAAGSLSVCCVFKTRNRYSWPSCTLPFSGRTLSSNAAISSISQRGHLRFSASTSRWTAGPQHPSSHFLLNCKYSSSVSRFRCLRKGKSVGMSVYCPSCGDSRSIMLIFDLCSAGCSCRASFICCTSSYALEYRYRGQRSNWTVYYSVY